MRLRARAAHPPPPRNQGPAPWKILRRSQPGLGLPGSAGASDARPEGCAPMQIYIVSGTGGKTTPFEVEGIHSITQLKLQIEVELKIKPAQQRLIFEGRHLQRDQTLAHYNIEKESTVHLMVFEEMEKPPQQLTTDIAMAHMHEMQMGMRCRWDRFHEEKRDFDGRKANMVKQNGGKDRPKDKLKLNASGERITTLRSTVVELAPRSKLAALFSGRWDGRLLKDKKGKIFLDVNPDVFRTMLECLAAYKRKQEGPDRGGAMEAPIVAEDLQVVMDRLLEHFELHTLCFEPTLEEGEPPGGHDEPELEGEGDQPAATAGEAAPVEIVVDEGGAVDLPARTVGESAHSSWIPTVYPFLCFQALPETPETVTCATCDDRPRHQGLRHPSEEAGRDDCGGNERGHGRGTALGSHRRRLGLSWRLKCRRSGGGRGRRAQEPLDPVRCPETAVPSVSLHRGGGGGSCAFDVAPDLLPLLRLCSAVSQVPTMRCLGAALFPRDLCPGRRRRR
eukprot:19277_4